jgi:hypothetical protein
MRDSSSGDKLNFGDLSLEEAMDLSPDRLILEEVVVVVVVLFQRNNDGRYKPQTVCYFE